MFKETMDLVKETIKSLMTEEGISDERLEILTKLNTQVDELGKQHQELDESHSKMKDKYIEAITNFGTTKKPDDIDPTQPRSMEQIASDMFGNKK